MAVKPCIIVPCYNHTATVAAVARAARVYAPVVVVDDGSAQPIPQLPGCTVVRLERNLGKGAALTAGFTWARQSGFSHAITMDADGQHFPADVPSFLATAEAQPEALIVGIRDFYASRAPAGRRRSNAVATFWFGVETGARLGDTQCGFRCYPVSLTERLRVRSSRYAFESEFLVRAAWTSTPIVAMPVRCIYEPMHIQHSQFRPLADLGHITLINAGLLLQSWFVPASIRSAWSLRQRSLVGKHRGELFSPSPQASSGPVTR